jgi:acyl carrier protein
LSRAQIAGTSNTSIYQQLRWRECVSDIVEFPVTEADIIARVRAFILRSFPHAYRGREFDDSSDLLGREGLDSMAVMELVTFLEDEFGISVPERDVRSSNLETLKAIADYVGRRTAAAAS